MFNKNEHCIALQIFVMTSQILVNALCHGYINLNKINLIIFDECHRAVNDHPMRQIMQLFENCPKEEQPKVLGLSACLLNSNIKLEKVETIVQNLEVTFNAKVMTSTKLLEDYYVKPTEEIVLYNKYTVPNIGLHINNIINDVNGILENIILKDSLKYIESSKEFRPKSMTKKLMCMLRNILELLSNTGIYGASKSTLLHLIQLECLKKETDIVETSYIHDVLITEVAKCRKLLEEEMQGITTVEKIYNYSSDQIRQLFAVLKDFYTSITDNQQFCCIIFVQRRFTAKVLYQILKDLSEHNDEYKFLHPEFIIGYSNDPYKNSKEGQCIAEWNTEALLRFRNGSSNCIVATDVIDEGIDIPKCTLIVRYDLPMDVRTYIQSKGRARFATSKYVLLVPNDDKGYLKRYHQFKETEKHLQQLLVGKTHERNNPTDAEIKNELYQHEIEPYTVLGKDGVERCITGQTAISLINTYCALLLRSKFAYLVPTWSLHKIIDAEHKVEYKVSLKLPIMSAVKYAIFGDSMRTIVLAKRSAALKMCIELHKCGELTDNLMPHTADSLCWNVNYLFPNWIHEKSETLQKIGTKKKKRIHKLEFPSALYAAFPRPEQAAYLHIINITPNYCMPYDDNRHLAFYNIFHNSTTFGILSSKKMSKIPSFPIFMNFGELNITIEVNHDILTLSEEEIRSVKNFHTLLFSEVLQLVKSFVIFDNYNLDNCFLIVPVDETWKMNWEVIKQCREVEYIPASVPFNFKSCDYELAVVTPSYRGGDTYIVTQVCDDITPSSIFPTENYETYAHYYKEKYDKNINNLNQLLLEVKMVPRVSAYILPRSMSTESTRRKNTNSSKNLKEHLVPELCTRINFPSVYWLKARTLPSILHRLSQLLIAEDLRYTIALEAGLGLPTSDVLWAPLVITVEEKEIEPETVHTSQRTVSALNEAEMDHDAYHYLWAKDQEIPNLYRDIEDTQLIQIEHYCQFINGTTDRNNHEMRVKKIHFINKPSVPVPPIQLLSLKNSRGPEPTQIMHALTTKLGNDGFNLERLETLGDSYLKFIISALLYHMFPTYNEGSLTTLKGRIIGNRNLYYCGISKNIPGRMKVDSFVPSSNFIPPAYSVFRELQKLLLDEEVSPSVLYEIEISKYEQHCGIISENTKCMIQEKVLNWETAELQTGMEQYLGVQAMSDKTVADCIEALIGVYLNCMGIKHAATLLKWFQIIPNEIDITKVLFGQQEFPLINKAFTHPSYTANNVTECYQRLEFLGDAILDFLITCYIYENCGNLSPGALTDLRSALVNNITFACLTVRHGLHTALLTYSPLMNDIIHRFVKFQEERNHVVDDELLWILLEEDECNMAEHVDVPKILGDLFESTIGAIYLDSNKNLSVVWEIIYSIMHKEIDQFSRNIPKQPIRVLYETQGAEPEFLTPSTVDTTNIVMVPLKVTIAGKKQVFHGFGANKKQAKCAAAKQALQKLLPKI
ncbi:endoribonuclease Dicer isoform X2 [Ceratina calcarata]|uniref:ribonuclease III n=1 Tax=Ceratina calcarata TaxID=156304 RepID=A0AAJ7NDZ5_9HYME|nr:endoribonuclease Dicer isoform X2 [Ceratina calcarata]